LKTTKTLDFISKWLDRLKLSGSFVLASAAILVGVISGLGIWLFRKLIEYSQNFYFGTLAGQLNPLGKWTIILIPAIGGLVVGLIVHFFIGEERHHGVAGIMEAVALAGGRLRYKRAPIKAVASALSIGSGASVGPEDPSVQIGANTGSMLGQWLNLSEESVRALVAGGAAGGIASAFNAPIAGVFFAMEIVLGEISAQPLGVILIASVVASAVTQAFSGTQPAFTVTAYAINSAWELPIYLILGLVSGVISAVYIWTLYFFQDLFLSWRVPNWVKPAAAGILIGIVGLYLPQVFGVGYDTIGEVLSGNIESFWLLFALLLAKLFVTPISISGGFQGGVFAPALFLGAMLGGALGVVATHLFPNLGILPPAFAMVGMAAVLAGAVHAPLTAILLLFEMTHDYRIILPLMFAVAISMFISQRLQRNSVYTMSLVRKGILLERGRDLEVMDGITIGDVMLTEVKALHMDDTLEHAAEIFNKTHTHGLPVLDTNDELTGILSIHDLENGLKEGTPQSSVSQFCTRDVLTAFPDETMGTALRRMGSGDIGRLPVVSRENPKRLVGILSRTNLVRAYDLALTRRAALHHRVQQVRLGALRGDDAGIVEMIIQPDSLVANKAVKSIQWPRDCIVASVRRRGHLIIPHGDTILRPGDYLIAVAEPNARMRLSELCQTSPEIQQVS
jgi:chloride channel protein, CIC family